MYTDRFQIVKIVKELGKHPEVYDWDVQDTQIGKNSWLLVYESGGDKDSIREAIAFLGTRFMTNDQKSIDIIHVSQFAILRAVGKIFFADAQSAEQMRTMKKGVMFSLPGWVIPVEMISVFLECFMDGNVDTNKWEAYYNNVRFFDDFEGSGSMCVATDDL